MWMSMSYRLQPDTSLIRLNVHRLEYESAICSHLYVVVFLQSCLNDIAQVILISCISVYVRMDNLIRNFDVGCTCRFYQKGLLLVQKAFLNRPSPYSPLLYHQGRFSVVAYFVFAFSMHSFISLCTFCND